MPSIAQTKSIWQISGSNRHGWYPSVVNLTDVRSIRQCQRHEQRRMNQERSDLASIILNFNESGVKSNAQAQNNRIRSTTNESLKLVSLGFSTQHTPVSILEQIETNLCNAERNFGAEVHAVYESSGNTYCFSNRSPSPMAGRIPRPNPIFARVLAECARISGLSWSKAPAT